MPSKVCFIGHRQWLPQGLMEKLQTAVEREIANGCRTFTMGTHGDFDALALAVCRQLKTKYPTLTIEVVLTDLRSITVPLDCDYQADQDVVTVMYEIETVHPKRRIIASNQQMIDSCDTLICFADPAWGLTNGTHTAVKYARKRGLNIINLYQPLEIKKVTDKGLPLAKNTEI